MKGQYPPKRDVLHDFRIFRQAPQSRKSLLKLVGQLDTVAFCRPIRLTVGRATGKDLRGVVRFRCAASAPNLSYDVKAGAPQLPSAAQTPGLARQPKLVWVQDTRPASSRECPAHFLAALILAQRKWPFTRRSQYRVHVDRSMRIRAIDAGITLQSLP